MAKLELRNLDLIYPMVGTDKKFIRRRVEADPTAAHNQSKANPNTVGGVIMGNDQSQKKGIKALDGLNMKLRDGDRLALIGRNGAGKSTLLRVMSGIYKPSGGEIISEGKITGLYNLNLGVNPELSGYDNILIRALMYGYSKEQTKEILPDIVEFADLGEFLSLPIKIYSSGMRMRLLFAVATALSPDILLLDEWISAGDQDFREKADKRMKAYLNKIKILVLASHNANRLKQLCNKFYDLDSPKPYLRPIEEYDEVIRQKSLR